MDIGKNPNKRKTPTPSEGNQNQEDQQATEETNCESAPKTKAGTRKSRQKRPYRMSKNNYNDFV